MGQTFCRIAMAALLFCAAGSLRGQERRGELPLAVRLYGYVKLDAAWDSSRMVPGNYCLYAASEAVADDDSQFNLTASQSRLGFDLTGPAGEGFETGGRLEFDFYGGGPENKARPLLRHAYLRAAWKGRDLEVLAGQTWDVISAFYLPTIYYTAGMAVGDYGYRRPQLRLTKGFAASEKDRLELRLAVTRTIGDGPAVNPFTPGDTGEDAGFPTLQGRLAWRSRRWFAGRPATLAVYGHYGEEEYDLDSQDRGVDFASWSVGAEFALPLHPVLALKGSIYTGENLDTYVGGVIQGVNPAALQEIGTTGGFLYAGLDPAGPFLFHLGWGVDDPRNDDLPTDGTGRSRNELWFVNGWYRITGDLRVGLEFSYWETDYRNARDGTVFRGQLAFQYLF